MTDTYLEMAERVLAGADRPLSAKEIITIAQRKKLLAPHLYGLRQDRTLHARLSENISRLGPESRFFRAGPGIYYLRALKVSNGKEIGEFFAHPRKKDLKSTDILCLDADLSSIARLDKVVISFSRIIEHLSKGSYSYRSYNQIKESSGAAIFSFLIVHDEKRILSYRRGKFTAQEDPLHNRRTIGLGGAVTAKSVDFLYESFFGIAAQAIDDLCSGIGLPRKLGERARYQGEIKPIFGVRDVGADGSPCLLNVVLTYRCPQKFIPSKSSLVINDLKWIDPTIPINDLLSFDPTSKFLISEGYIADLIKGYATGDFGRRL